MKKKLRVEMIDLHNLVDPRSKSKLFAHALATKTFERQRRTRGRYAATGRVTVDNDKGEKDKLEIL